MLQRAVLIVHPEREFGESLAAAVRESGVACEHFAESGFAKHELASGQYDLLVVDIDTALDNNLDLLRHGQAHAPYMPVVLIGTKFPCAAAAEIFEMPVIRFVPRPYDTTELGRELSELTENSLRSRIVDQVESRLKLCLKELEQARGGRGPAARVPQGRIQDLPMSTLRMLADSLSDLLSLRGALEPPQNQADVCQLLECPRRSAQTKALWEAVDVLQQTRSKFKSRELAQLRSHLEGVLKRDGSCWAP